MIRAEREKPMMAVLWGRGGGGERTRWRERGCRCLSVMSVCLGEEMDDGMEGPELKTIQG